MSTRSASNFAVWMLLLVLETARFVSSRAAAGGEVHFFEHANFRGEEYVVYLLEANPTQKCMALPRFDNKASSVQWHGLVQSGSFAGHARIAFYTDLLCSGPAHHWSTAEENYPSNFQLDGINDKVSSFMIWASGSDIRSYALVQLSSHADLSAALDA